MSLIQDYRQHVKNFSKLLELDAQLIDALIQPAIDDGFLLDSSLKWQDPSYRHKASSFAKAIYDLSEFYRVANPIMSSALWGIWNTVNYFEKKHGFFWVLIIEFRKRRQDKLFLHYRGLVATAACQFADGTPTTSITSDAAVNIDAYEDLHRKALEHLKVCGKNAMGTW